MKTRFLVIVIVVIIIVSFVSYFSIDLFSGVDEISIAIIPENYSTKLMIVLDPPIDFLEMVPITTIHIFSDSKPIKKIEDRTYHPANYGDRQPDETGTRWELLPNSLRVGMLVTDENGNDVIDRNSQSSFARNQPLYVTEATCDDGNIVKIKYGAPVYVPLIDDVYTVYDTNSVDGLVPNEHGQYLLRFASFFEQDIKLPEDVKILHHISQTCKIDEIKNYQVAHYDELLFEMQ